MAFFDQKHDFGNLGFMLIYIGHFIYGLKIFAISRDSGISGLRTVFFNKNNKSIYKFI